MVTGEVRLWKMTRRMVREALDAGRIKGAILPTGSTEQHNEHLAMEHDTASTLHIACQAALELYPRVVVATPIGVGLSEHWMEFRGTLTLKPDTFFAMAFDICESLKRHGIEHIFICNGHAGNSPLGKQMEDFRQRLGIDVRFASYWQAYDEDFVKQHMESGDCPAHAAEFETSMALAAFPGNVHWDGVNLEGVDLQISNERYAPRDPLYFEAARDLATPGKGRVMLDAATRWVVAQMREMMGE